MNILICSRKQAVSLLASSFPANTAVISFHDPDTEPPDYQGKCSRLFCVGIHDIDIEVLSDYGMSFESYFPEADALADFIKSAHRDGLDILCQCEYGQSRSAACAAAILEYYERRGIEVFADYRYYPNQLVFNKLLNALRNAAFPQTHIKETVL